MTRIRTGFRMAGSIFVIIGFLAGTVLAGDGLVDPGFEAGTLDGDTESWDVVIESDSVTVVDSEGPADSSAYADAAPQITVTPTSGQWMVRLGSPKQQNEKQELGPNTVTQMFTPAGDTLTFTFRLFSWEHRGDDVLRFDIRGEGIDRTLLEISFGSELFGTCDSTIYLCEVVIGDGKREDLLDTGWIEVEVTGLPVDDSQVALEYSLIGGENKAHASWVYFDNVNRPPVAQFEFNASGHIEEGGIVSFTDKSYDPDPGDSIVSWEWVIDSVYHSVSPDAPIEYSRITEQNPTFVFPENGDYAISLTVTDSFGATDTKTITVNESTATAALSINNYPALVRALNQEVLAEDTVELFGRFVDPGWLDIHTAQWLVGEVSADVTNPTLSESNGVPFAAIGTASADYQLTAGQTGDLAGQLIITDSDFAASSEHAGKFTIRVLNELVDRELNNDRFNAELPALESGWIYLSTLERVNDVDIFEIVLPGADKDGKGEPLPAGSEVLVKLKNLPADFDLVVFSELPDSADTWDNADWARMDWARMDWARMEWARMEWARMDWARMDWARMEWSSTLFKNTEWARMEWARMDWARMEWARMEWARMELDGSSFIDEIPLSILAEAELDAQNVGGSDINFSELGLESFDVPGVSLVGFSGNRGLDEDSVLVRTDFPGTRIYVAIVGNNGAFSTAPYSLQVETSEPVDIETTVLNDQCNPEPPLDPLNPLVGVASGTSVSGSSNPSVLFVTQKERFDVIHADSDYSWNDVQQALDGDPIPGLSSLSGLVDYAVLNINSAAYNSWDTNPCSVEEANLVSDAIRDAIVAKLTEETGSFNGTGIQHIVFIGSDNIMPFHRVPDQTVVSNEKLYVQDSQLKPGSPLFMSLYRGYNLTDDFYVDNQPTPFQGRKLYIPKLSVARLVETPEEIASSIRAFVSSGGMLNATNALVTGYDFFIDGAQESETSLGNLLSTTPLTLYSDSGDQSAWDLIDLRCNLLGPVDGDTSCVSPDINNVNAHYTHYGALTAWGFETGNYNDYLSSQEISVSGSDLSASLNYTVGCHSGLSVPDGSAIVDELLDANLDLPQAYARHNAIHVGSTGFGLGETEGVGGTEKLLALFSDELTDGGTVGQALIRAKQRYINSLSSISVYDEKSSIQTTMYGLPMYRLNVVVAAEGVASVASSMEAVTAIGSPVTAHYAHSPVSVGDVGNYFNINGEYQTTAWRSIQPKVVEDVTQVVEDDTPDIEYNLVHGVLITGGEYVDIPGSNPVISKPGHEWTANTLEPQICVDAFWPSNLATINTLPLIDGLEQNLIVIPGQFRCDSGEGNPVRGVQRNITSLTYELTGTELTAPDAATADDATADYDFIPPTIREVDLRVTDTGVQLDVDATDDQGKIAEIVLLVFHEKLGDGTATPDLSGNIVGEITPYILKPNGAPGPYVLKAPNFDGAQLMLQVVDDSGNIAIWSAKGANARPIEVHVEMMGANTQPATLKGTIVGFEDMLVEDGNSVPNTIFYRWEFGDGGTQFGKLAVDGSLVADGILEPIVSINGDGSYSFTVEHMYQPIGDDVTAILKVTDALGGIGVDEVTISTCGDSADLDTSLAHLDYLGCGTSNDTPTTLISIYLELAAPVIDGNQFRVHLDLDGDGKDDEMLKYNSGNDSATGLRSLVVKTSQTHPDEGIDPKLVIFTFNLAERGFTGGETFGWYAETQDGVSAGAGQGFIDRMPDAGYFTYTLKP